MKFNELFTILDFTTGTADECISEMSLLMGIIDTVCNAYTDTIENVFIQSDDILSFDITKLGGIKVIFTGADISKLETEISDVFIELANSEFDVELTKDNILCMKTHINVESKILQVYSRDSFDGEEFSMKDIKLFQQLLNNVKGSSISVPYNYYNMKRPHFVIHVKDKGPLAIIELIIYQWAPTKWKSIGSYTIIYGSSKLPWNISYQNFMLDEIDDLFKL